MKLAFLLLCSAFAISCSNPRTFVLDDTIQNSYSVSQSILNALEKDQIDNSPLIVINGTPLAYNKKQDTVILPFKKSDLISLEFVNKNSSRIIYNEKENDGAIIITTKTQNQKQ